MREDITCYRDAMNNGTWVDGEFHSDKELASKGIDVTTTSDEVVYLKNISLSEIKHYKNFSISPIYPDKYEECAMRYLNCRGKLGYKESFYDRWPTKKSRIGYLFYLGAMVCSRLLQRFLAESLKSNWTKLYCMKPPY